MKKFLARVSVFRLFSAGGVLGAVIALLWAWLALRTAEGPVIISFTSQLGILRVGSPAVLYGTAIVACVALLIHSFLVHALEKRNRFLAGFLAVATFFLGFLIFIAYAAIISVN